MVVQEDEEDEEDGEDEEQNPPPKKTQFCHSPNRCQKPWGRAQRSVAN